MASRCATRTLRHRLPCLFFVVTTIAGGACAPDVEATVAAVLALQGNANAGAAVYDRPRSAAGADCASCHGEGGIGDVDRDIPPLNALDAGCNRAFLARVVLTGQGAMPSFIATLTEEEVADVVAFVVTLQQPPCP